MIRKPAVAGMFYPGDKSSLLAEIKFYLNNVNIPKIDNVKIIISPHAGYMYSGPVAAYGYKMIEGKEYDNVFIFAPSHRAQFSGISIYNGEGYETPLGIVEINQNIVKKLFEESNLIKFYEYAHVQEHSLEVQLPFLQVVLNNKFKLIPALVGTHNINELIEIAKIVNDYIGEKDLIVLSTDLSHYYNSNKAKILDSVAIEDIKNLDIEKFYNDIASGKTEACGFGPLIIGMAIAKLRGWNNCEILKYADSGDVSGDKSQVVGYVSAVIYDNSEDFSLNEYEKDILHKIAYESIKSKLENRPFLLEYEVTPNLAQKRGAFVTLHKFGQLRGCIGNIIGIEPLHETVKNMARAAAFEDPRFPSLKYEELKDIDIEISVLSPLKKVKDINEIEVGKHGIYLRKGFYSGLLLPQVATEYNWDRLTFLDQTCIKAGMQPGCWKDRDTEIYIFSADVF